ncbi:MAG TPA: type III pantothenate kinase [Candidatus Krumholzibacteria bacterium]|nr:type III pantothenate kinase [Candidatus Krumholzibacteria bacterium]
MTLCADVGNTSIKIALVEGGRVGHVVTVASGASARAVEAAARRAARGHTTPPASALCSVRPRSRATVAAALARVCGAAPLVVGHGAVLPIRLAVRRPATLGADRICAAVGALGARGRSAIVVDAGTAVTVDLVTDRVFRGGVILPGPALSMAALHAQTAQLPELDFEAGPFPPGGFDRTDLAMRWGVGLAAAGGIVAAVEMLRGRAGRRIPVVVTGGGAGRLRPLLPAAFSFRPHLTLLGLDRVARLSLCE